MTFSFETHYNANAMSSMAKALRKTVRKKHSRRAHIFGWIVTVLALLLLLSKGFSFDFRTVITVIAVLAMITALLFEDRLNGYAAKKRLLPGTEKAVAEFKEDCFVSTTEIGKTEWNYDRILLLAETADFFVFIFSASHAQLYDKRNLHGGTVEDFRHFIEAATGKRILPLR